MKNFVVLILAMACLGWSNPPLVAQEAENFVVIVHPDNPAETVTRKRVSQLLLKEVSRWNGSLSAQPVDLDSSSPVRDAFSRAIHGRSVSSIKNYWQRKIFSGSAVPPPEVSSDEDAINFVRSNTGAIGYVSTRASLDGVKVLEIASK
ncbi:MAG: hypothetical protein AAF560_23555 [Acidobacteriota bacterium]